MTALNAVRNLPPVAQGKVVAVGWAFGGAAALQLFRASSEADGLLGVAAFSPAPVAMSTVASAPMAPGPGVRLALFIGSEDSSNRRRDVATSRALYTWTELGGAVAGFSQADLPTKDAAAAAADAAVAAVASGGDDVEGGTDNPRPKR
jgi:dienelactone hydrolase